MGKPLANVNDRIVIPDRPIRRAKYVKCRVCDNTIPVRNGRIAGHYAKDTTLCFNSGGDAT